jgi:signal transduction histidine kinase
MTVALNPLPPPAAGLYPALLRLLSPTLPLRPMRRVLAAGDVDRQRIERDLHDGVQQRLTGLRLRIAMAARRFQERGDADASAALDAFGEEVEQAIDEIRAFARGVYPAVLSSNGLAAALRSACRYAAVPVTVSAHEIRRCRPEVENAVYFTCLAAIDNAAKHAGPAQVSIHVWETAHSLHVAIRDTGRGFDPSHTPAGSGLTNMRDRITALGGTLVLDSSPQCGTRLHGTVPDPWPDPAARWPHTTTRAPRKESAGATPRPGGDDLAASGTC